MNPGGPLREVGTGILWLVAAGNLFVLTVKTFKATYTSPPLATWQTGAGEPPKSEQQGTPSDPLRGLQGESKPPPAKKKSLWETFLGEAKRLAEGPLGEPSELEKETQKKLFG